MEDDRTSFSKYYTPKVEIKDKEKTYEKIIEMSKNNNYIAGLRVNHYKLVAIDLSKVIELENPGLKQQINFIGKL